MNPADLKNIEDVFPMSDIQKGMIYYSIRDGNKTLQYYNQTVYRVKYKDFDPLVFKRAYCMLSDAHPALRTAFNMDEFDQPVQLVYKAGCHDCAHEDLSDLNREEQKRFLTDVLKKDRETGFDVSALPLCRMKTYLLGGDDILFFWVFHHVILDGWSNASFLTELNNTYLALIENPDYRAPELRNTYKAFVVQELADKKNPELRKFWKNELNGFRRLDFSSIVHPPGGPHRITSKTFRLGKKFSSDLHGAVALYGASVKILSFAAYIYLLKFISYEDDITVGLVTHSRPLCPDGEKILGCFLNTFPVRIKIPGAICWKEFVELVAGKLRELKQYERLPLFEIVRAAGEKTDERNPLFDTYFNFVDFFVFNQAQQDNDENLSLEELNKEQLVEGEGFTNAVLDLNINTTFGGFELYFAYFCEIFPPEFIDRLAAYFQSILRRMISDPYKKITNSDLLSVEEKEKLLVQFNATAAVNVMTGTVHREFEKQADLAPWRLALVFTETDCRDQTALSYSELNRRADRLACFLQRRGLGAGRLIALMAAPSLEMFIGMLGILKRGAGFLPIDPATPVERVKYLLSDSNAAMFVSQRCLQEEASLAARDTDILYLDDLEYSADDKEQVRGDGSPGDLLYTIYTSGTTGRPKGVLVEHRSMVNYVEWAKIDMKLQGGERTILTSSFAFDLGYSVIFPSLMLGGELHIVPKSLYIFADKLLEYYGTRKIDYIKATPSFFSTIANNPEYTAWNTRTLKFAILGGEALNITDIETAFHASPQLVILHEYGPTEATVGTNIEWIDRHTIEDFKAAPNIGGPLLNVQLFVLNRHQQLQPPGVAGELCASGVCLARGYLNRPEMTAEKFPGHPLPPIGRIYRTGDLARWWPNGKIQFIGRIDQQVKVRGYRIELGEIETVLRTFQGIREAVATIYEPKPGDKYICAYIVADDPVDISQIRDFLRVRLPDYMMPAFFLRLEKLPLNQNGKVDKRALPVPSAEDSGRTYIAPSGSIEAELTRLWADILDTEAGSISSDAGFFEVGGHSLNATVLLARVQKKFSVRIPWDYLFASPTVKGLAEYIERASVEKEAAIDRVEDRDYYPLSSAQERLFVMQRMEVDSTEYNMPQVFVLGEAPDSERLHDALNQLIQRHESLRTSFELVDGKPVQRICDPMRYSIETPRLERGMAIEDLIERFIRPFQLDCPPLIRLAMAGLGGDEWLLMMDVHHIAADGLSLAILERDFTALYSGRPLPPVSFRYRDFANWHNRMKDNLFIRQETFWLERFSGGIPLLHIPTDFPRPKEKIFDAGGQASFELTAGLSGQLNELASQSGCTLFMVLLAMFNVFLAKLCHQEAIIVGTPVSGRRSADIQDTVGMFVNTLAMKNEPLGTSRFGEFLEDVRLRSIQAFENQDYPFEDLVDRLKAPRIANRNPLFDVIFALHNMWQNKEEDRVIGGTGMKLTRYPYERGASICDMIWTGRDNGRTIGFSVQYNEKLFAAPTIQRFVDDFIRTLECLATDCNIQIKNITLAHNLLEVEQTLLQEDEGDFDF